MTNAAETVFEIVDMAGIPALYSDMRLDAETIPKGMEYYEVRDDDYCSGTPCQVTRKVLINFFGSLIMYEKHPAVSDHYGLWLDDGDLRFLDVHMTLEEATPAVLKRILAEAGPAPFFHPGRYEGRIRFKITDSVREAKIFRALEELDGILAETKVVIDYEIEDCYQLV